MGYGTESGYGIMNYDSTGCYSSGGSMQMPNQHMHRQESSYHHGPSMHHHESSYHHGPNMHHPSHTKPHHGYGYHQGHSSEYGMSGSHGHGMTAHSSSMYGSSGMPYGSGPMTNEMSHRQSSFDNGYTRGYDYDQRLKMQNGGRRIECVNKGI